MDSFLEQVNRLASLVESERSEGRRNLETDSLLEGLRDTWKAMDASDRNAVGQAVGRITELVSLRPRELSGGTGPADTPRSFDEPDGRPPTSPESESPGLAKMAVSNIVGASEGLLSEEQSEARMALQGLDRIQEGSSAPIRFFDGPRDPDRLLAYMGYDTFRSGQREAVAAALEGRDCSIVMPTGGGKSLCYQLPGLAGPDLTLVVSPLIALMADQIRRLRRDGHPAVMFASGLPEEVSAASHAAVQDGTARMAYCSPERFGSSSFLDLLATRRVDLLAIDEAHCLSEWGHDFRPDYLRLPKVAERLGRPPVMTCTATATPQVAGEITRRMGMRSPVEIHSGFDRPNLSFDTVPLEGRGSKARKRALLEFGLKDPESCPAIVYCGTRKETEEVAEALRAAGINAVPYHAGMAPDERASAQVRFMDGDIQVITATNAFGMGVDKADIRSVWHWAIPSSVEAYYQEAGRAGRDGRPAKAVLLAMRSDLGRLVRFNQKRKVDPADVIAHIDSIRSKADGAAQTEIDAPRLDTERTLLAVAERAGVVTVDPAPGGRLSIGLESEVDPLALTKACRIAEDRGWKAYRAIEEFSFSTRCRRRQLLEHFGDTSPPTPEGRCCDVCDPDNWLPDAATVSATQPSKSSRKRPPTPPEELSPEDQVLFEELRKWRLEAAGDRPAFHVASNRTLMAIASTRPRDLDQLLQIHGVGPAFIESHAADVLRIVSD